MDSKAQYYRNRAEEARHMAAKPGLGPEDKQAWLRLAEDWLGLAQTAVGKDGHARLTPVQSEGKETHPACQPRSSPQSN
jgi:hypothetical protein